MERKKKDEPVVLVPTAPEGAESSRSSLRGWILAAGALLLVGGGAYLWYGVPTAEDEFLTSRWEPNLFASERTGDSGPSSAPSGSGAFALESFAEGATTDAEVAGPAGEQPTVAPQAELEGDALQTPGVSSPEAAQESLPAEAAQEPSPPSQSPSSVAGTEILSTPSAPEVISSSSDLRPPPAGGRELSPGALDPPDHAVGNLYVGSYPWGRVYVNGEAVGTTPIVGLELPPGVHLLRIEREGYAPYREEIEVSEGSEVRRTEIVLDRGNP